MKPNPDKDKNDALRTDEKENHELDKVKISKISKIADWRAHTAVAILVTVNLLNYADRYSIAALNPNIEKCFKVCDGDVGLTLSVVTISILIAAPIFGYLGDRFDRRPILAVGLICWAASVLASSFIPCNTQPDDTTCQNSDKSMYIWFLFCRAMCGVGEASYVTVAPTVISDLFSKQKRSTMIMLFNFAIPVGTGVGYGVGAELSSLFGDDIASNWRWGIRLTPVIGLLMLFPIAFLLPEPPRGLADAEGDLLEGDTGRGSTSFRSYLNDLLYLVKNKTYMLVLAGYVCYYFVYGALSFWAPTGFMYGELMSATTKEQRDKIRANVPSLFGVIVTAAGFFGVGLGTIWSALWKRRGEKSADCLVSGISGLIATPFIFFCIDLVITAPIAAWIFSFLGCGFLTCFWAVTMDLTLYIVTPERRATATGFQGTIAHLLGDAISSLVVGAISQRLLSTVFSKAAGSDAAHFYSLQLALYLPCFFLVIGGGFFMFAGWFVEADRLRAQHDTIAARTHRTRTILASSITAYDSEPQRF